MGEIKRTLAVKLIAGIIFKDDSVFKTARSILGRHFGKIDLESQTLPFELTDYYEREFGPGLKKVFLSFRDLILAQDLYKIKILTNKIENKLSLKGSRLANIDPGYIDAAKLVLASTKDYKHRIYLNKGIYAEITLSYRGRSFEPLECTYNDYKTGQYIEIFNRIRQLYLDQT